MIIEEVGLEKAAKLQVFRNVAVGSERQTGGMETEPKQEE